MAEARGVEAARPLLSISIPTYNRSLYLAELLECLVPQLAAESLAELIVSDNASTDDTEAMVAGFRARGLNCRYLRNPENIGPDANFLQCLELARGKYVWVLGDDDLLAPDTVRRLVRCLQGEDFDLVYLSSTGFSGDVRPAMEQDRLGRFAEIVTDGGYFLEKVNALIGLISVTIVNKDRLLATPHPPITELNDTNLLQVGWLFPVIHQRCRVLFVWERLLFYRSYNSGGWGVCEVFGVRLRVIARRYFAAEPALARKLMNGVLRYWMFDKVMEMRRGRERGMADQDFRAMLEPLYRGNWRYWCFIYPVASSPLWLAGVLYRGLRLVNKLTRAAQAVWRHGFRSGKLLRP